MGRRTRGWWLIRLEFAIALAGLLLLWPAVNSLSHPFGNERIEWFGLPSGLVLAILGVIGLVVGFVWMTRIARGPRDEPPAWRYRDH